MKKIGVLLTALLSLLALTGCGLLDKVTTSSSEGTSLKPTTTETTKANTTVTTSNKNNTSSNIITTIGPTKRPVQTTTQAVDVEDETSSLKNRISELALNIDEMPDGKEMFFDEKNDRNVLARKDYTNPTDDYYALSPYYAYNQESWDQIDAIRNESMDIRNFVLKNITQLDAWVSEFDTLYYVNYDSVSDVLNIKCKRSVYYYEIASSYTSDNKILLNAIRYTFLGFDYRVDTLYYVEDEIGVLCRLYEYESEENNYYSKNCTLIESNLQSKDITILEREMFKSEDSSYDLLKVKLIQEENGIKVVSSSSDYNSPYLEVNAFDSNGYSLGRYSYGNNTFTGRFSLYELDGWDSAIFDETLPTGAEVTIKGVTYTGFEYIDEPYCDMCFSFDAAGFDIYPVACITSHFKALDYNEFMKLIQEKYGLTPKHEYSLTINNLMGNIKNLAKNRTAFGITDYTTIDSTTFTALFNSYNKAVFTYDDFYALSSIDTIDISKQEENYYSIGYLEGTTEGKIAFDFESMTLNPKDLKVVVPNSSLLSSDFEYKAMIVSRGSGSMAIAESDMVKADNGLIFTFKDENISIIDKLYYDFGTIEVIVLINSDNGFHKISKNIELDLSLEDRTYPLPDERSVIDDGFLKFNCIITRNLVVSNGDTLQIYMEKLSVEKEYLDATVEGELAFNFDSMTLNPKNIVIKVEDVSNLPSDFKYVANIIFGGNEKNVIARGILSSIDGSLTLSFEDDSYGFLSCITEEKESFQIVVYMDNGGTLTRISKIVTIPSHQESGSYNLPDTMEVITEDSKEYNVTYHRSLIVSNDGELKMNIVVTSIDKEEIVNNQDPVEDPNQEK